MPKHQKPAQSTGAARTGRDRQGRLVQARISDDLYEKLAARAARDMRSMSNYVEFALAQYIETTE